MGRVKSRVRMLYFKKANFLLFKATTDETPWEMALRDNEAEQSWQLFKDIFLRAQKLSIPTCINLDKEGP